MHVDVEEDEKWAAEEDAALAQVEAEGDAGRSEYSECGEVIPDTMVSLSQFAQKLICYDVGKLVDYTYRPWMPQIMDSEHLATRYERGEWRPPRWTLLKCSRQVEKTVYKGTRVLRTSGAATRIEDIQVGDTVIGASNDHTLARGKVSWKSEGYTKPALRIRTRQGHEIVAGVEHPFRRYGEWVPARDLVVGDRLAVVRRAGEFSDRERDPDEVQFIAWMLGDGYVGDRGVASFTQASGEVLCAFREMADRRSWVMRAYAKSGCTQLQFSLRDNPEVYRWLAEADLKGKLSATKVLPAWVWDLPREQTSFFLNRLWSADGHVKLRESYYHIEYCSISVELIRGLQRLLWKFGIPSRVRENLPEAYKGTDSVAYILRVETADGARKFLEEIGALGKGADVPLPPGGVSNSNRDVAPQPLCDELAEFCKSVSFRGKRRAGGRGRSFRDAGLLRVPPHRLTWGKYARYIEFFREHPDLFDAERVDEFAAHLDSDVFWDEVVSIEDAGEQPCYDITVDGTDSFVGEGFVTHNSSSKSFKILGISMLVSNICCLYVSSAGANTREFADERIHNTLNISPKLSRWGSKSLRDTMAMRRFANNSRIVLRSVYRDNAERVRGIPTDLLAVDELQSVFQDAMPVIEASLKNSDMPMGHIRLYSGTPLTSDNHLEVRWSRESTQNLWLTRCGSCGHWNPPGLEQVGRRGMICSKCGYALNPLEGQWIRTGNANAPYEGYHLSQVMMPYTRIGAGAAAFEQKWAELYADIHSPTAIEAKVRNEIIGESYDVGRKPLTQAELRACLRPYNRMRALARDAVLRDPNWHTFMGVDWGSGTDGNAYTVVSLMYAHGDGLRPFVYYMKRYEGPEADPKFVKHDIARLFTQNHCTMAIVDDGFGWGIISELRELIPDGLNRVIPCYLSGSQSEIVKYDKKAHRLVVHRTRWMSKVFSLFKKNMIDLPCAEDFMHPFGEDILHIHYEELPSGSMRYGHVGTDDSFFAILFGITAKMWFYKELDEFANA